jgi:iron-sulfur cluster assembly protein
MSSTKPVIFDPNLFSLSKAAIDHFETKLNKKPKAVGVRFSVKENDGCSGYSYDMDYVSEDTGIDKKNDLIISYESFKVFVDNSSFKYLKGTKVDFLIEGANKGVIFNNPNVKAVCGCGESFDIG